MLPQYKLRKVSEATSSNSKIQCIIGYLTGNGAVKTSFIALENENYGLKSELEDTPNHEPSQYTAFELKISHIIQSPTPPENLLGLLENIAKDIKKKFKELRNENRKLLNIYLEKYLENEFYFNIDDPKTSAKRAHP